MIENTDERGHKTPDNPAFVDEVIFILPTLDPSLWDRWDREDTYRLSAHLPGVIATLQKVQKEIGNGPLLTRKLTSYSGEIDAEDSLETLGTIDAKRAEELYNDISKKIDVYEAEDRQRKLNDFVQSQHENQSTDSR